MAEEYGYVVGSSAEGDVAPTVEQKLATELAATIPTIPAFRTEVQDIAKSAIGDATGVNDAVMAQVQEDEESQFSRDQRAKIAEGRLAQEAVSTGIHGWHNSPQHIHDDGIDYIGGIEGEADSEGMAWVVVDVIDHKRNKSWRVPVFKMPVDDHSPAAIMKNPGINVPAIIGGVPHQVGRPVKFQSLWLDSFGIPRLGTEFVSTVPNPSDTGSTSTYIQLQPMNQVSAAADGYSDVFGSTRMAWHWFAGVVRLNHETKTFTERYSFRDLITFRDVGFPADGDQLQGYINTALRVDGKTMDLVAFGHPKLATDRDVYAIQMNLQTGDIGNGLANFFTGAGLPFTRRQMEVVHKRQPNTNLRTFGVGGLYKRQVLICKWDTTSGYTAATPANNRYKLLTRQSEAVNPGLVSTGAGWASTATRPEFNIANLAVEVFVVPSTTRPAAAADVASKWNTTNNQRSWRLYVNPAGTLTLSLSTDGLNPVNLTTTATLDATAANVKGIAVGYNASTGVATFYTSSDGKNWEAFGSPVSGGPTSIYASTASVQLGRQPAGQNNTLPGNYQRLKMRNGWGGTLVFDVDFTRGWANGETGSTRLDYLGNNWVMQTGATILATAWTETADFGPTGDPFGYDNDTQYVAGGLPLWLRDDAAMVSRRLPGGLWRVSIMRQQENSLVTEEVLYETLLEMLARPVPVIGEGGPTLGSVSGLTKYGPDYTTYASRPILLWKRGPVTV